MRKHINNKRYDTEDATLMLEWNDPSNITPIGKLYRKKTGEYFIFTDGKNITPISDEQANSLISKYDPEYFNVTKCTFAEARKRRGYSQTELGKYLGIKQAAYCFYESGKCTEYNFPAGAIYKLSKLYKVSMEDTYQMLTNTIAAYKESCNAED